MEFILYECKTPLHQSAENVNCQCRQCPGEMKWALLITTQPPRQPPQQVSFCWHNSQFLLFQSSLLSFFKACLDIYTAPSYTILLLPHTHWLYCQLILYTHTYLNIWCLVFYALKEVCSQWHTQFFLYTYLTDSKVQLSSIIRKISCLLSLSRRYVRRRCPPHPRSNKHTDPMPCYYNYSTARWSYHTGHLTFIS